MKPLRTWLDDNVVLSDKVTRPDDISASVSHGLGFVGALGAALMLLMQSFGHSAAFIASLVYGISLCMVFGSSSIYHGLKKGYAKRFMRLVDHSSIYVLIAGTYTPYSVSLGGREGRILLFAIWGLCAVGLVLNFLLWGRFKALHLGVYLAMGWLILIFWRPFVSSIQAAQIQWMLIGGASYTLGVFFYLYRKLPLNHSVWHLFVMGGAAGLHVGIARYAIPSLLG